MPAPIDRNIAHILLRDQRHRTAAVGDDQHVCLDGHPFHAGQYGGGLLGIGQHLGDVGRGTGRGIAVKLGARGLSGGGWIGCKCRQGNK